MVACQEPYEWEILWQLRRDPELKKWGLQLYNIINAICTRRRHVLNMTSLLQHYCSVHSIQLICVDWQQPFCMHKGDVRIVNSAFPVVISWPVSFPHPCRCCTVMITQFPRSPCQWPRRLYPNWQCSFCDRLGFCNQWNGVGGRSGTEHKLSYVNLSPVSASSEKTSKNAAQKAKFWFNAWIDILFGITATYILHMWHHFKRTTLRLHRWPPESYDSLRGAWKQGIFDL